MVAVVRSAGATVANRALHLAFQSPAGFLTDVFSAQFQIFDSSTPAREGTPVQIFPVVAGTKVTVDLLAHRLSQGRYAAVWAPDAAVPIGHYFIRWFYRTVSGGPELSFDQEFELVSRPYNGPNYCTLYDVSGAGMIAAAADDGVAQAMIVKASRFIEHYTGRTFYPLYKSITVGGRHGRSLLLDEAIVAIESVNLDWGGDFPAAGARERTSYRVYNRHLTQNLFNPDDRENPHLEFLHGWGADHRHGEPAYYERFSSGAQNVQINGIFGYTEPDNTFVGGTPTLIRHACLLLCFHQAQIAAGSAGRQEALTRQRLKSEYTRDQGFIYADPGDARSAPFLSHTLDPEIDAILNGFRRPIQMGAA